MAGKREALKEKLSAQILEAALSEFAEKGYQGTTIQSISDKADASVGVICKYYESKEGLLCAIMGGYTLKDVFEGFESDRPEEIFYRYINIIKDMKNSNTTLFNFYRNIFVDSELNKMPDGICSRYLIEEFRGSIMEKAILRAQEEGSLPEANPDELYLLLVHSVLGALQYYSTIGLPEPDNSFFLNVIQFDPTEKDRRRFIEEKEQEIRGLSKDLRIMMRTINRLFPLSIYCNLSKNKYHMLDYDNYYARKAEYSGTYDELIEAGMSTINDGTDRESFLRAFNRQALLESFNSGRDVVGLMHTQTGDDGVVRMMYTRAIMSKDECGDIISISVAYELPEYLQKDKNYRDEIMKFNEKLGRG